MHPDVVWFGESVGDELEILADPESDSIGSGTGEQTVVEPAPPTEPTSIATEGESGTKKGIDFTQRDFG